MKMDFPKEDYTIRKGLVLPLTKVKTMKMDSPKGAYTRGKGLVSPLKSQSLDNCFPEGRLRQTDRAGIFHLRNIKTMRMDSPEGDYTRRKGLAFLNIHTCLHIR